jgi:uncharacterized protein YoaH (UPF0181 family)
MDRNSRNTGLMMYRSRHGPDDKASVGRQLMAKQIRNRQVIAAVAQKFREKLKAGKKKSRSKKSETSKHKR